MKDIIEFAKSVMDGEHEVLDFDLDRVEVKMNGEDYIIRTWDISEEDIRWTLFKKVSEEFEEIKSGVYYFSS